MKVIGFQFAMFVVLISAPAIRVGASSAPPGLADDSPCLKVQWPITRTLVWARPGESGTAFDAANWIEYASFDDHAAEKNGKPATAPPDSDTDIVLPAAPQGEGYIVGCMVPDKERRKSGSADAGILSCRHISIGHGASLDAGMRVSRGRIVFSDWCWDDSPIKIHGNVTVEDGGSIYGHLQIVGDQHTWICIGASPEPLARELIVRKTRDASVVLVAKQFDLVDAVDVESGELVLAPETHLRINATYQPRLDMKKMRKPGWGRVEPYVHVSAKAALVMGSGSRIGRITVPDDIAPDLRIEGLLQIGRPGDADSEPAVIELTLAEGDGTFLNQPGGLYFGAAATVNNFGRLAITAGHPGAADTKDSVKATPERGVSIFLEKQVDLGKVSIDYLRPGGIAAIDPVAAKNSLARATFGEHCAVDGEALYSQIAFTEFTGGDGTIEFVDGLTTECEILFPLGNRLIVRSKGNRITQSFDLKTVHAVTIDGKRIEYHPTRALSVDERKLREVNALWADVPGTGQIGEYGKQRWPRRPLMVWRRPGFPGSRFVAANWLDEKGRPYFRMPVSIDHDGAQPDTDILLPAGETFYKVVGDRPQWRIRHMTIEANAFFHSTFNIGGNFWVKDGGGLQSPWFGAYRNTTPGVHRFLRFDGERVRQGRGDEMLRDEAVSVSQWGSYVTGPDGTLELVGTNRVNDQFTIGGEGTLIISEGAYLAPGARACFAIKPEATVVLLQDARISLETTAKQDGKASVWVGGTLLIGTPERPITRDMVVAVSGIEEDQIIRNPSGNIRTPGVSWLISEEGRMQFHSVDPKKARLIFKMYDSDKAKEAGKRWGDPKGIVLAFFGEAHLNGVVFDNVLKEGLMVSPAQRATWKNVSFGENNLVEPDELFWNGTD